MNYLIVIFKYLILQTFNIFLDKMTDINDINDTDINDINDKVHSDNDNSTSIYRFEFNKDFIKLLNEFAVIHQYDDRKIYKEFWAKWIEENHSDVNDEITRLGRLGYEGDIIDKMFKAGRYYFRKKNLNKGKGKGKGVGENNGNDKKKERRNYITMNHDVLCAMDTHINLFMKQKGFTPASGYIDFCTSNVPLLTEEIESLCSQFTIDSASELSDKINRYPDELSGGQKK